MYRRIPSILTLALLAQLVLASSAAISQSLAYPRLSDSLDPVLQQELVRSMEQLGLTEAARDHNLAVALVDITDRNKPRMASINGNTMMYSASLPKIAILLGAFQRFDEGALKPNKQTLKDITDMIRHSSNVAASRVLEMVGPFYLIKLLQSERYHLYDANSTGGLWVGKPYGKSPAYKRDPLHSMSHGATAHQVARYYYLLETGRLVSGEASRTMKEILGKPAIHHKFVAGLEKTHPDARIFRKSGTWRTYHSDSAIIERDGKTYIAVALVNNPNGGEWLSKLIVEMDDIIFRNVNDNDTKVASLFKQESAEQPPR